MPNGPFNAIHRNRKDELRRGSLPRTDLEQRYAHRVSLGGRPDEGDQRDYSRTVRPVSRDRSSANDFLPATTGARTASSNPRSHHDNHRDREYRYPDNRSGGWRDGRTVRRGSRSRSRSDDLLPATTRTQGVSSNPRSGRNEHDRSGEQRYPDNRSGCWRSSRPVDNGRYEARRESPSRHQRTQPPSGRGHDSVSRRDRDSYDSYSIPPPRDGRQEHSSEYSREGRHASRRDDRARGRSPTAGHNSGHRRPSQERRNLTSRMRSRSQHRQRDLPPSNKVARRMEADRSPPAKRRKYDSEGVSRPVDSGGAVFASVAIPYGAGEHLEPVVQQHLSEKARIEQAHTHHADTTAEHPSSVANATKQGTQEAPIEIDENSDRDSTPDLTSPAALSPNRETVGPATPVDGPDALTQLFAAWKSAPSQESREALFFRMPKEDKEKHRAAMRLSGRVQIAMGHLWGYQSIVKLHVEPGRLRSLLESLQDRGHVRNESSATPNSSTASGKRSDASMRDNSAAAMDYDDDYQPIEADNNVDGYEADGTSSHSRRSAEFQASSHSRRSAESTARASPKDAAPQDVFAQLQELETAQRKQQEWIAQCNKSNQDCFLENRKFEEWDQHLSRQNDLFAKPMLAVMAAFAQRAKDYAAEINAAHEAHIGSAMITRAALPMSTECDLPDNMCKAGIRPINLTQMLDLLPPGMGLRYHIGWATEDLMDLLSTGVNQDPIARLNKAYIVPVNQVSMFKGADALDKDGIQQALKSAIQRAQAPPANMSEVEKKDLYPASSAPADTRIMSFIYNVTENHWLHICFKVNQERTSGEIIINNSYKPDGLQASYKGNYWKHASTEAPLLAKLVSQRPELGWQGVNWLAPINADCPRQHNQSDCGFFAWYFAKQTSLGQPLEPESFHGLSSSDLGVQLRRDALEVLFPLITGKQLASIPNKASSASGGDNAQAQKTTGSISNETPPASDRNNGAVQKRKSTRKVKASQPQAQGEGARSAGPETAVPTRKATATRKQPKRGVQPIRISDIIPDGSDDDEPEVEHRISDRTVLCDFMITQGRPLSIPEICDGVKEKLGDVRDKISLAVRVTFLLLNTPATFERVQPDIPVDAQADTYDIRRGIGHSVDAKTVDFLLEQSVEGTSKPDDIDIPYKLRISCTRQSTPSGKRDAFARLDLGAYELMEAHHYRFHATSMMPVKVENAEDIEEDLQCPDGCWVSYGMEPRSSTCVAFDGPGDENIRQILDAADAFAAQQQTIVETLLLIQGWDGLSTNNESWQRIVAQWPNLDFHLTMVVLESSAFDTCRFRLDVETSERTIWAHYDVSTLAALYTADLPATTLAAAAQGDEEASLTVDTLISYQNFEDVHRHAQFLEAMIMIDHFKLDHAIFHHSDLSAMYASHTHATRMTGSGQRNAIDLSREPPRVCEVRDCGSINTEEWERGTTSEVALRCGGAQHDGDAETTAVADPDDMYCNTCKKSRPVAEFWDANKKKQRSTCNRHTASNMKVVVVAEGDMYCTTCKRSRPVAEFLDADKKKQRRTCNRHTVSNLKVPVVAEGEQFCPKCRRSRPVAEFLDANKKRQRRTCITCRHQDSDRAKRAKVVADGEQLCTKCRRSRPVAEFWDANKNKQYMTCNRHIRGSEGEEFSVPDGEKFCTGCKMAHPVAEFWDADNKLQRKTCMKQKARSDKQRQRKLAVHTD